MSDIEIDLIATVPDGVDSERVFDAIADLVHGSEIKGVEVFCSGQGQTIFVHVFIDDTFKPSVSLRWRLQCWVKARLGQERVS